MTGKLILEDGSEFEGMSFGAQKSMSGELVFTTGMVGYPESFTDISYFGQILVLTYPIVGNYGVPQSEFWESKNLQIRGLVVSQYIETPSHFQSQKTLGQWLKDENVPGLEIKDTRLLTQTLRDKGAMLGKIIIDKDVSWYDPNKVNVVSEVSTKKIVIKEGEKGRKWQGKTVVLIDCGPKRNIIRNLTKRGARVIVCPWNKNPLDEHIKDFDAAIISNGPGDPKMAHETILITQKLLERKVPMLGICLGHQILALAASGNTKKLKFGHRSQNQPCIRENSKQCFITTQNHGFYVNQIPSGFREWFRNANDQTNEGIIHKRLPIMSVQFHPEATPGPTDTEWIFDFFLQKTFLPK